MAWSVHFSRAACDCAGGEKALEGPGFTDAVSTGPQSGQGAEFAACQSAALVYAFFIKAAIHIS
jgi:hypothetical protein